MDRAERLRRIMEQANLAKSRLANVARRDRKEAVLPVNLSTPENPENHFHLEKDEDATNNSNLVILEIDETSGMNNASSPEIDISSEVVSGPGPTIYEDAADLQEKENATNDEVIVFVEQPFVETDLLEEQKEEQPQINKEQPELELEAELATVFEPAIEPEVVLVPEPEPEPEPETETETETETEPTQREARLLEEERQVQAQTEQRLMRLAQDVARAEEAAALRDSQAASPVGRASEQASSSAKDAAPDESSEKFSENDGVVDDIQEDVLPIVLEEAQEELIPEINSLLARLFRKDHSAIPELHRKVHTLKGSLAMVGANRGRALMHSMETWMEKAEAREVDVDAGHERLAELFESVKERIAALARGDHLLAPSKKAATPGASTSVAIIQTPKRVHLKSDDIDRYITEINEARLANSSLSTAGLKSRQTLSDLEEKAVRIARILRELEIHAESQIQSRRTQVEESGEEFDPLEFDRYTHLQEIARFLSEGVNDVMDLQKDMVHQAAEQETITAYQGRAIESVQEGLQRTRLIPADALADRLHKVAWATSRELSKPTDFYLEGGRQALDRMLLEKIASPLEHIIRNSIAHGVESASERLDAGKPASGSVVTQIRQEAGRVHIVVKDDGRGLDPERIKQKAVSKNMWPANRPMSMSDAADMICSAGFSTAESVSEVAGRGVGMDVVRSEVMAMGGRFEIQSITGQGMSIAIVLPTAIASISVVLVEAAGETWAVPVEMVEHMDRITHEKAKEAISDDGKLSWKFGQQEYSMRYRRLADLMGIAQPDSVADGALLILRTGDQRAAVFVDSLSGVAELPMRSLGKHWSSVPGVMGATILPAGRAGFLVDPLRADWSVQIGANQEHHKRDRPLVLVVDDSITVRKVTARFLERHGYDHILAKDGQEAVEMLVDVTPDVILLDVEMPRMDGFDCARHIRENPKVSHVPIVMITSRTADKHRQRALSMGVNAYLGKPYKEEELLPLLAQYAKISPIIS